MCPSSSPLSTSISPIPSLPASTPSLRPALSLKYVMVCRYTTCLAGGGASPGQTEGKGGGAHRGETQPTQIGAPEPPLPPDPGLAEVRPASQGPGKQLKFSADNKLQYILCRILECFASQDAKAPWKTIKRLQGYGHL